MAVADLAPGEHATNVRNHWWWRPGWQVGRRFYAFHVTFGDQRKLHDLVTSYRDALSRLQTVTPVPDRWLHLTMQGLGFTDEIQQPTLDRVRDETGAALRELPPLKVQFREAVVADEAIAMPATPAKPVQHLRHTVRGALGHVLDQVPEDAHRFRPHISVAYITADGNATPYLAAVSAIDPEPVSVRIDQVSLIEMHRDHRMYEWDTVATFPLRGPRPASTRNGL